MKECKDCEELEITYNGLNPNHIYCDKHSPKARIQGLEEELKKSSEIIINMDREIKDHEEFTRKGCKDCEELELQLYDAKVVIGRRVANAMFHSEQSLDEVFQEVGCDKILEEFGMKCAPEHIADHLIQRRKEEREGYTNEC